MASRTSIRNPQLTLGLHAARPDPAQQWREGATLAFLGRRLNLHLSMTHREATLDGDALHLPLPPQASAQQIRDRAETWLREQALVYLGERIRTLHPQKATLALRVKLAFAAKSAWVECDGNTTLRCHWRLIEQPDAIIEQTLKHALNALPCPQEESDLFGSVLPAA
jgi:predicted metal-dependent hydrolase